MGHFRVPTASFGDSTNVALSGTGTTSMYAHEGAFIDDEVVYLRTITRRQRISYTHASTMTDLFGRHTLSRRRDTRSNRTRSTSNTPNHRATGRAIQRAINRSPRSTVPRPRVRRHSTTRRGQTTIRPEAVGKLVQVGWLQTWQQQRQPVYGTFSAAHRFTCHLRGNSAPIAHKDIEYAPQFRSMMRQQIQDRVHQVLQTMFSHGETGEV